MKKITLKIWLLLLLATVGVSCKDDFLEQKPRKSLLVPTTLDDAQAMLDNILLMNMRPAIADIAAGQFVLIEGGLDKVDTAPERGAYLLDGDPYQGNAVLDWDRPYEQVLYANIVLDALEAMPVAVKSNARWGKVRGAALFFRARAFYELSQLFCKTYQSATAAKEPGIPMPLSSDVNLRPGRGTLAQSYDRIKVDMLEALSLLEMRTSLKNRPSGRAALAMLAKVSLSMGDYRAAGEYADRALGVDGSLIDFNGLKAGTSRSFPEVLPNNVTEVIFYTNKTGYGFFGNAVRRVDPVLLASYHANDLRKAIYFYHTAAGAAYSSGYEGLGNDEQYLIGAEAWIRLGDIQKGLALLKKLMDTRYKTGTFQIAAGLDQKGALALALEHRKKGLIWRGTRWYDLKRLNAEGIFTETITRTYQGKTVVLEPGDRRYVFPIPEDEIRESGIEQN